MNMIKKWTGVALVALAALALAPAALAQDVNQWEINADVDNDGIVGPTDIQHVINEALGLNDRGTEAVNRPLRHYVVASPRASLALRPGANPEAGEPCDTVGAATNFQRDNGRLVVRKGTAIAFRFDRNMEGVWHDNACGLLRTGLVVEIRRVQNPEEAEGGRRGGEEPVWHPVGRDGAEGRYCGPAVGTANVAVRHLFDDAGYYLVRCTIQTAAIPDREVARPGDMPQFCGATRDVDQVLTLVRVVDRDAVDDDIDWQDENDPPAVGVRFGSPLDREVDDEIPLP